METLFKTVSGSHLYNLDHPGSDLDYFTVVANEPKKRKRYARQTIDENLDSLVLDFTTFRVYCDIGVPQCLEAIFSPVAEVDHIAEFRYNYHVDTAAMIGRYRRTIKAFSLHEALKRKRHALRLAWNLREAVQTGRFNPRLSELDAMLLTDYTESSDYFETLERIQP